MRKHKLIPFALIFVAAFCFFVWTIFRNPYGQEPQFQNEPLSAWLERFDHYNSAQSLSVSEDPRRSMRRMGTNVIPYLVSNLKHRDPPMKTWILTAAQKLHLYKGRIVPQDTRYRRAGAALLALGPDAAGAVPELAQVYDNNPAPAAKIAIALVFARVGPAAAEAVPALVRGTTHPESNVRYEAVVALGAIHANPVKVVPALTNLFNDPSPPIRVAAIDSLGRFGADARPAMPALLDFMKSPTTTTQAIASWLVVWTNIQRIDPDAAARAVSNGFTPPQEDPRLVR